MHTLILTGLLIESRRVCAVVVDTAAFRGLLLGMLVSATTNDVGAIRFSLRRRYATVLDVGRLMLVAVAIRLLNRLYFRGVVAISAHMWRLPLAAGLHSVLPLLDKGDSSR